MKSLVAVLLLAAAPDLAWLVDDEIPVHISNAGAQAAGFDQQAAESDRLRAGVLQRRKAAADEKAALEAKLPTLKRGDKTKAELRLHELAAQIAQHDARARQLELEAKAHRASAASQRAFAAQAQAEGKARAADAAKYALASDVDFDPLADARLADAKKYYGRRLARVPKQLAALEAELTRAGTVSVTDRGSVVARKDAVRALAAADEDMVRRIEDELRFRSDSKADEEEAARLLEQAGKAKAAELESPTPVPGKTPDRVDAMLERVIAAQDQKAADEAATAKMTRRVIRIAVTVLGIGALGAVLVFVLRRVS